MFVTLGGENRGGGGECFHLFEKACSPNCLAYTFLRFSLNLNIWFLRLWCSCQRGFPPSGCKNIGIFQEFNDHKLFH